MAVRRLVAVCALPALALAGALTFDAVPVGAAPVTTYYVAPTGHDAPTCTSANHPCKTINYAVGVAASGDTVSVAAGTYAESVFMVNKTMTITGPTAGTATITGADGLPGVNAEASKQIPSLTLSHLHVSGIRNAPGIVADGVRTTITHSTVSDNVFAGVETIGAPLSISDSTFTGTRVASDGEGNGSPTVEVGSVNGRLSMTRTTVSDSGEIGVYLFGATQPSTITDSTVSGNGFGGIVSGLGDDLTIDATTVAGNTGLGVYAADSRVAISDSTVSGTTAAVNPPAGAPTRATGVYDETEVGQPPAALAPSRTTRYRVAGGRHLVLRAPATPRPRVAAAQGITVSGSVLDQTGKASDCAAEGITDAGYNLSADSGNSCGFSEGSHDVVKTDPKLGALADNGGPTRTQLPPKGSAAIDAIPTGTAGCTSGAADQRGVARPQGTRCDMGAVEREQSPLLIAPKTLPHGTVGTAYREQLHASGGLGAPYVFSLATGSTLPAGLTISPAGLISGTPTKAGTVAFTVSVDDPVTRRYTLIVDPAATASSSGSAQPNGGGSRLADTGAPTSRLTATGGLAVLAGLVLLVGAGAVGRRQGRHRAG